MKPAQQAASLPDPSRKPETSPFAVVGWLLVMFAIIPVTMGGHGEGKTLLTVGVALAAVGIVLVVIGRVRRGRTGG